MDDGCAGAQILAFLEQGYTLLPVDQYEKMVALSKLIPDVMQVDRLYLFKTSVVAKNQVL